MASTLPSKAQGEATDLGSLWTSAVRDYLKQTGKSLSKDMEAQSIGDVMKKTEKAMESFQGFRHKGDKVDKVRSAFGRHLDGMQKCMAGIEMVGAMAGAFPPAMPVGLVFAACGHLLAVSKIRELMELMLILYTGLRRCQSRLRSCGGVLQPVWSLFRTSFDH